MTVFTDLETRIDELSGILQDLPTDYRLAERYMNIDQEIYAVSEWVKANHNEVDQKDMDTKVSNIYSDLDTLALDIQYFKSRVSSRDQHGDSYSR